MSDFEIYRCNQCGCNLRIPADNTNIQIKCTKCGNIFNVNRASNANGFVQPPKNNKKKIIGIILGIAVVAGIVAAVELWPKSNNPKNGIINNTTAPTVNNANNSNVGNNSNTTNNNNSSNNTNNNNTGNNSSNTTGTTGLTYEAKDGSYMVTGYKGSAVNIVIPDTYNNIAVTSIDNYAFKKTDIQSITLGNNITKIGLDAFRDCTLLKDVKLGNGITLLRGFQGCTGLKSITIPASVTSLGNSCFSGCKNLSSVTFASGSKLANMDTSAFANCTSLKELKLPSGIKGVGKTVFKGFTASQTVYFPCDISKLVFYMSGVTNTNVTQDRMKELITEGSNAVFKYNAK